MKNLNYSKYQTKFMESEEAKRFKDRAEDVLESFYGLFLVWDVTITSFTPQDDKINIAGFFFEDSEKTKKHQFTMIFDRKGRLHDCKIT
jgi:hypothetical protein